MGAACIIPDPSALFPGPRNPLPSSPVTPCHLFCRNQGGGKVNEKGQMPTTDPSKPLGKLLSKTFPAYCLSTSCWESSTCECGLASFPKRKLPSLALLCFNPEISQHWIFKCFCTFLLCSCLAAFLQYPSLPARGDLSPIKLKNVMGGICDGALYTEFELALQNHHCKSYRFRFSSAKERIYQYGFFFKSHVKLHT